MIRHENVTFNQQLSRDWSVVRCVIHGYFHVHTNTQIFQVNKVIKCHCKINRPQVSEFGEEELYSF